ncbi:hypothetical protein [Paenibacillus oceani]|uniref:Uncharacterized protein n=1 Tax=Paenibacillus oceani TaxID=2772510 RepID=A0A927CDT0_9BACL|nr:hypothetical protein [Paenibacillus oceani]MBD2864833.1 hypothetical protein [Paenibacillus oceani]
MTADVKLDEAPSAAKAEIDAEALAKALNEAEAGEVKGTKGAQNIEVMLPTAGLTDPSAKHQIELVTEHGVVRPERKRPYC